MSKFFINRPIVAMVIAIVTVIVGAVIVAQLPVAQFPQIAPPEVQIKATYVGADSQTIEQSVATPIEQQMSGVDKLNYMYSLNAGTGGQMLLTVNFDVKTDPNTDLMLTQMRENVYLQSEVREELHFDNIIGASEALRRVMREVETVAPTDSTVLIYGETGTGKELIARAVHNLSSRKPHAFVKLNCAAIPASLLESELFGHERGAFTGATMQRMGRFELAHRGSIFLDEVGEIPLELQPKLLRVLQEREFERLGGTRTLRTDARLVAATNRDLKSMVETDKFRSDLYYRLNVFPVRVPPLRERVEDIPALVRHFVQEFNRRNSRNIDVIPSETMDALLRYPWPGNVRELQNIIERAVIVSTGSVLQVSVADLQTGTTAAPARVDSTNLRGLLNDTERAQILRALEECNWVVAGPAGAAARLNMKRTTLQVRMQKLGIQVSRRVVAQSGAGVN